MTNERPPIGTRVRFRENGNVATVIPTHWQAPDDEVDVMLHGTGSVMTARVEWLAVLNSVTDPATVQCRATVLAPPNFFDGGAREVQTCGRDQDHPGPHATDWGTPDEWTWDDGVTEVSEW